MLSSVRALFDHFLDYAGLFPPARLPLEESVRNYAGYRQGPQHWMLGRFICPAARLVELGPLIEKLFSPTQPLPIAVIGTGAKTWREFEESIHADRHAMDVATSKLGGRIGIEVYEVRAPEEEIRTDSLYRAATELRLPMFVEVPAAHAARVSAYVTVIADLRRAHADIRGGIKIRCGGLESAAFPSAQQIAHAIVSCRNSQVPIKFTAGLHHAMRWFDRGIDVWCHGFLNVFAAGLLAWSQGLGSAQVQSILEEEDARAFRFDEQGFSWQENMAGIAEIGGARKWLTSFGSCSWDEPLADLRALAS
jgi:hypothetical protein